MINFIHDDGGRSDSGYKGQTGDCVTRAIAIATEQNYKTVYKALTHLSKQHKLNKNDFVAKQMRKAKSGSLWSSSVRYGGHKKVYKPYLESIGWEWIPIMKIGSGCKIHLREDELPETGRYILKLSRHLTAYVDGILYDTYDCSRWGSRCVYGYFRNTLGNYEDGWHD